MYRIIVFVFLVLITPAVSAQPFGPLNWGDKNPWVDSVYESMTQEQRIAQLMMIAAWSGKDSAHIADVTCHVQDLGVGGIIFFKGTPTKQATLTNYYQSISRVPLLIGIDGEWGLSMRLDSTPVFPRQIVMGGAANPTLTYEFGKIIGKQCRRMGIHFNFAPVVDVNNNPLNPVINDRSFGENRNLVALLGTQYMKGMQEEGVIASAKHFPGHGDVTADSHYSLPVVAGNRERLDSLELFPFKQVIDKGVMGVMTAHLFVPALDSTPNRASSLSPLVIKGLLKKDMGFDGLVVTDALNMKGVADYYGAGEVAAKAFMAGNDILLFVEDVPQAIGIIQHYIDIGEILPQQLEYSCKKILLAKYWAGLANYKPIEMQNLIEDLNCCEANFMIESLVKQGVVVAVNKDRIIPIENPHLYRIAVVSIGTAEPTVFQEEVMKYVRADYFSIDKKEQSPFFDSLYDNLFQYNLILLSLHGTSRFVSRNLGLTQLQINFINKLLASNKRVVLINHGNAYILSRLSNVKNAIVAYEDLEVYNKASAQVLFGGIAAKGTLPVSVNKDLPVGAGEPTSSMERFSYTMPIAVGADDAAINKIDSIVAEGIRQKAFPGCQVLVAHKGQVIYQKSFGTHTYDMLTPVANHHTYDLASLTKILSTTLAVMALYDDGKIVLTEPISTYLPELTKTNKSHLRIDNILLHQAGLPAYIPFYNKTLIQGKPHPLIYSNKLSNNHNIEVARGLYMHRDYEDFVWQQLIASDLSKEGEYLYSDLGFIMLGKMVERVAGTPLNQYVQERIYERLSLHSLGYKPIGRIPFECIVPTEQDNYFRHTLLIGNVHDQTASLMGGVAGHAGLFGNANDVAIIMQMLLRGGTYGKQRILYENTVKEFTRTHQRGNRRGYGFDKPETDSKKQSPLPSMVSPLAFGHTGFTGTAAWADPQNELLVVFLSNRVHPDAENKKLVQLNIRSRIIEQVYAAFGLK
jgi:beta-N-acetylhexosaminidase